MEAEFKRGQWVLCRDEAGEEWCPYVFCKFLEEDKDGENYLVFGGWKFRQCLPLEGNEELVRSDGGPEPPKPEIEHYEFLERVEVYVSDDMEWVPGVYVTADAEMSRPHRVLIVETRSDRWFRDSDVRHAVRG